MWPRVIGFLGYYPLEPPQTLAERLLACRRCLGLSREAMAQRLTVDEGTLARWETERVWPTSDQLCKVETVLAAGGLLALEPVAVE